MRRPEKKLCLTHQKDRARAQVVMKLSLFLYALRAESATKFRKVLLFWLKQILCVNLNRTKLVIDLVIDTGHPLRSEFVLPDHCHFGGVVLLLPCT